MRIWPLVVLLLSPMTLAHSMSPAFEVEQALTAVHTKVYTLTNEYKHPAVFTMSVLNKDGSVADGWRVSKKTYKLMPNSKRDVKVEFKIKGQRKLLVCSTLTEIGKQNEKATIITRICSRLIINGISS